MKWWHDLKRVVKERRSKNWTLAKVTGSGPPIPPKTFTPWEEKVLAILLPESLTGVAGGAEAGDEELNAEDHTNDQQSQSPPPAHGLSDVDSQDSLDDELQPGPSGVPQTQRSQGPILPATTAQQTPAVTVSASTAATTTATATTTSTTSTTCSTLSVPGDDQATAITVEGRKRVRGPTVARQEVRGSRAGGRARVTTRPREEWTPSLDHFTRVVEAYQEVQRQSGRSDELLRELILLMRSIDNLLGQMVDLMGQQVALQRDRPVSQPPPPSPPVVPQDDSAPSSPAPTERGEPPHAAGHSAAPPPRQKDLEGVQRRAWESPEAKHLPHASHGASRDDNPLPYCIDCLDCLSPNFLGNGTCLLDWVTTSMWTLLLHLIE
ncbi:uncharacterized protein LOC144824657 [Lissotriton helveticus]